MSVRSRATVVLVAVLALVAALAAPAGAQDDGSTSEQEATFYLGADATTVSVSVLGTDLGSFAGTRAVAEQDPVARATSFGFRGGDGAVAVAETAALADAVGATVRDPAGDGLACDAPALPDELPVTQALTLADVCSVSYSAISGAQTPQASGDADAGRLAVNGQLLADVVLDLLLDPILTGLEDLTAPFEAAVVEPVDDALAAVCDELPEDASPATIVSSAEETGLPVGEVIEALPNGEEIAAELGDDCLLALTTMVDLGGVVLDVVEDELRAALLDTLDRDLLEVVLGSSSSSLAAGDLATARAEIEALAVSTPSLAFLLDAVDDLVIATLQDGIDEVTALVPTELETVVAAIPALDDVVDPVLDALPLDDLVDDEPLLRVAAAAGVADARAPIEGGEVDISDSSAGTVVVTLSSAVADLLGVPAETTVAPGESQTIAEGTPLESTVSAGQVEPIRETLGSAGVATAGARVTATDVRLLTGVEGGIALTVGEATARVGGTPSSAPVPSLPRTGSNDRAGLIVAGLLAAGALGGLGLRSRLRD